MHKPALLCTSHRVPSPIVLCTAQSERHLARSSWPLLPTHVLLFLDQTHSPRTHHSCSRTQRSWSCQSPVAQPARARNSGLAPHCYPNILQAKQATDCLLGERASDARSPSKLRVGELSPCSHHSSPKAQRAQLALAAEVTRRSQSQAPVGRTWPIRRRRTEGTPPDDSRMVSRKGERAKGRLERGNRGGGGF